MIDKGSNPGEIATRAHGSKQGFLLERRARLVAASVIVHSFCSDQPRLRVDGLLSNRLEKLVRRVGGHADGFSCMQQLPQRSPQFHWSQPARNHRRRLCDAVGGIMAAPRWSQASMLCSRWRGDSLRRMCAAHTDLSSVTVVAPFSS